ncbi:hypothetical protein N7517_002696 [Penicillium concentricum]|uniref:Uncharacterized protein n=1 Tax=Penicillium concentricum TaxID=293559 RepID=A0A9W9SUH7_9EURO|nr:uncharacterized protein N7517_002696 [Penicillium concentricum]KAJ5384785.1 hypothetical protein N7517_002696 [Penicillium concentricum]
MEKDLAKCQAAYDVQYADIIKRINAEDDDYLKASLQLVDSVPPQAVVPATATGLTTAVPDDNDNDNDELATSTNTTSSMLTAQETLEQSDEAIEDEINSEHDLDGLDDLDHLGDLKPNDGMESMDNHSQTSESPQSLVDQATEESD